MKHLNDIIFEKLKISKSSKKYITSFDDIIEELFNINLLKNNYNYQTTDFVRISTGITPNRDFFEIRPPEINDCIDKQEILDLFNYVDNDDIDCLDNSIIRGIKFQTKDRKTQIVCNYDKISECISRIGLTYDIMKKIIDYKNEKS